MISYFDTLTIILLIALIVILKFKPKYAELLFEKFIVKVARKTDFISMIVMIFGFGLLILTIPQLKIVGNLNLLAIYIFPLLLLGFIISTNKKQFGDFGLTITSIAISFLSFILFYSSIESNVLFLKSIGLFYTTGILIFILFILLLCAWYFPILLITNKKQIKDYDKYSYFFVRDYPSNKRIIVTIITTVFLLALQWSINIPPTIAVVQTLIVVSIIDHTISPKNQPPHTKST